MDFLENEIDAFDMAIWEAVRSISEVKKQVQKTTNARREELLCLQNKLMEAAEWLKNHPTE